VNKQFTITVLFGTSFDAVLARIDDKSTYDKQLTGAIL